MHLRSPYGGLDAVCSVIVYSLFVVAGLSCVLVMWCCSWCTLQFSNHLVEEERAGCFTLIVLRLSMSHPLCADGWSTVCNCGISWSKSLNLYCSGTALFICASFLEEAY